MMGSEQDPAGQAQTPGALAPPGKLRVIYLFCLLQAHAFYNSW